MTTKAIRVLIITAVWMALWRSFTVGTALGGIGLGAAVVAFSSSWPNTRIGIHPIWLIRLTGWAIKSIVLSSIQIAWLVLSPRGATDPGTVDMALRESRPALVTLIAQLVTLSPGTVSVAYQPAEQTLRVHTINTANKASMRADLDQLEFLVQRAFPPAKTSPATQPC